MIQKGVSLLIKLVIGFISEMEGEGVEETNAANHYFFILRG